MAAVVMLASHLMDTAECFDYRPERHG
jgi:hypothetical protein